MAKIFRKRRFRELMESKTGKYLVYAVGEIVLVVLGILIALQINTWNNERLERDKEQKFLLEIRENLVTDTLSIERNIRFYQRKDSIIGETLDFFTDLSKGEAVYSFDKLNQVMNVLTSFNAYVPKRTAYENMIASEDISILRSDSLRSSLSLYYSNLEFENGSQTRMIEITRSFTNDITPKLMSREFALNYFGDDLDLKSVNQITVHRDEVVISNIFIMRIVGANLLRELADLKEYCRSLIVQIDRELER